MKKIIPYILLFPTLLIIGIFIYWPAGLSFKLSFYRQSPFGNREIFVGFKNFINLFNNPEYLNAMLITLIYVILTVFFTIVIAFLLSQLLNQKIPGTKIFRLFIFAPYAISPAIAGTLWSFLLNPVVGHLNYFFNSIFGLNMDWLTSSPYALIAVIMGSIWKMLPFSLIFYIAGLQSIPDSIIESSLIDGANLWKRMWKIKFPLLSPITFYLVIMTITSAMFNSFGIIDVMTKGGPIGDTTTLIYKLYLDAFTYQKTGPAAAQSIIMFIIMGVVTFFYFKNVENKVHYQ
ncbi:MULTISPECIES: carbohydrate ABC transporter permease [Oceanotoga]|jgi:sn-glycerol 3-phosphate transport system permease protein|uniref:carbohydrate ABC transporter permease n=1 Tax=Oceanotoga TaxID=1255275 RepID=UPI00264ADC9A|nr:MULTISPECIES: sugar ABC transporter permease [Oceanotoga]MDN5343132.1 sn-glycerol 3-phosphate transport system permease protein [Oceanotoga sp.]MDO7976155.1 sugar ABC transporter permease [Oceanotoga teriensis]